jgi:hypothetical protein
MKIDKRSHRFPKTGRLSLAKETLRFLSVISNETLTQVQGGSEASRDRMCDTDETQ